MMSTTEMVRGRIGCLPTPPRTAPPPEALAILLDSFGALDPFVFIWSPDLLLDTLHCEMLFVKTCSMQGAPPEPLSPPTGTGPPPPPVPAPAHRCRCWYRYRWYR